jgi:hypothetical protein
MPMVFTEEGVAMLSSVLRSRRTREETLWVNEADTKALSQTSQMVDIADKCL